MPSATRRGANTIWTLAVLGTLAGWSLGPNAIKYLSGCLDPWTQNFYRYLAASLSLLPALAAAHARGRLDPRVWRRALLPSAVNVIMQSGWAFSLYYINPGFMILLTKSDLIWVALFSFAVFPPERVLLRSPLFWTAVVLSVVGVLGVVLSRPDFAAQGTLTGIVLTLVTSLLWAAYAVSAKAAFRTTPSIQGFAVVCLYTTAGLGMAAAIFGRPFRALPAGVGPWSVVVVSGIVSIAVAHVLFYAAMKRIGATIPALILLASPFTVLAASGMLFGERLLPAQWLWGVVLLGGCALAILAERGLSRAD